MQDTLADQETSGLVGMNKIRQILGVIVFGNSTVMVIVRNIHLKFHGQSQYRVYIGLQGNSVGIVQHIRIVNRGAQNNLGIWSGLANLGDRHPKGSGKGVDVVGIPRTDWTVAKIIINAVIKHEAEGRIFRYFRFPIA